MEMTASLFDQTQMPQKLNPKLKFSDFWEVYPKRLGPNPRALAEKKYAKAVQSGADPEHIISSARFYGEELRKMGKVGTEFVCMASTWLNQNRYLDYAPDPGNKDRQAKTDADMLRRGYKWNVDRWEKI
jgi:hypothetical protein